MMRKYARFALCFGTLTLLGRGSTEAQSSFWRATNGPLGPAHPTVLATAPTGEIYAGVDGSGIYKSSDRGNHWTLTGLHTSLRHSESLLVTRNGYIFAVSFGDFGYYGSTPGITRSKDGGAHWATVLHLEAIDGVTLASASNGGLFVGGNNYPTVDRSTDFGDTWTHVIDSTVRSLTIDPSNNIYAARNRSVSRSSDGGQTWIQFSDGVQNKDLWSLYATSSGNILMLVTDGTTYRDSLMRSTDRGVSWTTLGPAPIATYCSNGNFASAPYGMSVYASGCSGILRSTDEGLNWSVVYADGGTSTEAFDSTGELLAATNAGILRSTNLGTTWDTIAQNFIAPRVMGLLCPAPNIILAATYRSNSFRSTDEGSSWSSLPIFTYQFARHPGGDIYEAAAPPFISTDQGASWSVRYAPGYPYFAAFDSGGVLYAAGIYQGFPSSWPRVWSSTDEGTTWTTLYTTGLSSSEYGSPEGFLLTPSGTLFVTISDASGGNRLMRTTDGGSYWATVGIGYPTGDYAPSMVATPSGWILAGTTAHGVLHSSDNGSSWATANTGLPAGAINAMAVNSLGHVFLGTDTAGVYRSTDDGSHWVAISSNLFDPSILSLTIDPDGYLLAGTRSSGVWRTVSPTTGVGSSHENIPAAFALDQNFPNPFNPTTVISYQLPVASPVRIIVFDILGREVKVLVNERKDAGTYAVTFDARGLASGVYLYRLEAGKSVQTRKLLLLR